MAAPVETYRGSVQTWECDEVGHQNVQFYVARADDAAHALAVKLGLGPRAQTQGRLHIVPVHMHVRFLRELRVGDLMHATSHVLATDHSTLDACHLLYNTSSDEIAATFVTRHGLYTEGGEPVAWNEAASLSPSDLKAPLPPEATPRSIDLEAAIPALTLGDARAKPEIFMPIATERVRPAHCDEHGRFLPQFVMGLFSNGAGHLWDQIGMGREALFERGRGSVVLEISLQFLALPRPGTPLTALSALTGFAGKTLAFRHCLFDAESGAMVASGEAVAIMLDLEKRKSVAFTEEEVARLTPHIADL